MPEDLNLDEPTEQFPDIDDVPIGQENPDETEENGAEDAEDGEESGDDDDDWLP